MIKNKTFIEIEVKGRDYIFICSQDSPLNEAYEAVKIMENYLAERLKAIEPKKEEKNE